MSGTEGDWCTKLQKFTTQETFNLPINPNPAPPATSAITNMQCGLVNLGQTCYANAVIKCLASYSPLTDYFTSTHGIHTTGEKASSIKIRSLIFFFIFPFFIDQTKIIVYRIKIHGVHFVVSWSHILMLLSIVCSMDNKINLIQPNS